MSRLLPALLAVAVLSATGLAGPITVDGDLTDWGIVVADGNGSNMNGYAGIPGIGFIGAFSEDQNDTSNGHYLGPNHGGQNYDAELVAAAYQNGMLYVAIVTGQRPDNGFSKYGPGDIRIVSGGVTYGIEVGGGEGGVPVAGALVTGGDGATYTLDGGGHTIGFASHSHPDTQVAGSLWREPQWFLDPINPKGPTQLREQFVGGDLVGNLDYVYTLNSFTLQHAVIELAIPLGVLGHGQETCIYWRPSCGNDELNLCFVSMPEPGTSILLVIGGLGLGGILVRERRRRKT